MSEETAPLVVTLKGGKDFDAPKSNVLGADYAVVRLDSRLHVVAGSLPTTHEAKSLLRQAVLVVDIDEGRVIKSRW